MMILSSRHVPLLFLVIRLVLGQTFNQEDAAAMAWRAYANFVREGLLGGSAIGNFKVFVTPPTMMGIAGGDPVPQAITNQQIYDTADGLQNATDPYTKMGQRSYVDALSVFLNAINPNIRNITAEENAQWMVYEAAKDAAINKMRATLRAARAEYKEWQEYDDDLEPFDAWVSIWYPEYGIALAQYNLALTRYMDYTRIITGGSNGVLARHTDNINIAVARQLYVPGITMRASLQDVSIPPTGPYAIAAEPATAETVLIPQYSMSGLESQCNAWLNDVSGQQTTYTFRMSRSEMNDWTSMGYSTTTRSSGGSLFGLLGGKTSKTTTTTEYNRWNSTFESDVELTLTLQGRPASFDIGAGLWDYPDVRALYNLIPGLLDPLKDQVRVVRVLLGFRPGIKMTIKDSKQWMDVKQWAQNVTKADGGGLRLFGISLGTAGNTISQRSTNELQITETTNNGGSFYIPPGPDRIPVVLGVLGRTL